MLRSRSSAARRTQPLPRCANLHAACRRRPAGRHSSWRSRRCATRRNRAWDGLLVAAPCRVNSLADGDLVDGGAHLGSTRRRQHRRRLAAAARHLPLRHGLVAAAAAFADDAANPLAQIVSRRARWLPPRRVSARRLPQLADFSICSRSYHLADRVNARAMARRTGTRSKSQGSHSSLAPATIPNGSLTCSNKRTSARSTARPRRHAPDGRVLDGYRAAGRSTCRSIGISCSEACTRRRRAAPRPPSTTPAIGNSYTWASSPMRGGKRLATDRPVCTLRRRSGGAERLVLAVDAANEPALRHTPRGFVEWDRRTSVRPSTSADAMLGKLHFRIVHDMRRYGFTRHLPRECIAIAHWQRARTMTPTSYPRSPTSPPKIFFRCSLSPKPSFLGSSCEGRAGQIGVPSQAL